MPTGACAAPATSLYLDPRGEVRACCQNEWGRLGNIAEAGLLELWRGERMARLRARVAAGRLDLGCELCAECVQRGQPEAAYARVFDRLGPVEEHPPFPRQLELALSNACNLRCVMCNGDLSSAIRIHRERRPPLPPVYGEPFFEELDEVLPHLTHLNLLGGEPFLGSEPLRVMERLVERGLSPTCSVTTNGTQFGARVERLVRSLPMHVTVSVDAATAETAAAVRCGVDHHEVLRNVAAFQRATAATGAGTSVAACLMRPTWHELGRLLLWAEGQDLPVFVNSVTHPPHLSLHHASREELAQVVGALRREEPSVRPRLRRNLAAWDGALRSVEALLAAAPEAAPDPRELAERATELLGLPPGAEPARVEADREQVVRRVRPGTTARHGLDLGRLVGGSLWEVVRLVSDGLGEARTTALHREGPLEVRTVVFGPPAGPGTQLRAVMVPGHGGAQTWLLGFGPEPGQGQPPAAAS